MPPKPLSSSNELFEASKFSASCLPNINITPNGTITYGSFKNTLLGVVGQIEGPLGHCNGVSNLTNQSTNFRHV
jgi:hypothetical protein